jgi:V/A-type H+-transporting ATPase subunit C
MQPEYGTLSVKQIEMMCEAETVEDVHKLLRATRYGKLFDRLGYNGEGNIGATVRFQTAKRYLHFSRNPSVVMLAFILLSNIELENVISLIEGVRYRVDPKVIESLLIR